MVKGRVDRARCDLSLSSTPIAAKAGEIGGDRSRPSSPPFTEFVHLARGANTVRSDTERARSHRENWCSCGASGLLSLAQQANRSKPLHNRSRNMHTFAPGDRGFSHYTMKWGTVEEVRDTDDGWFTVRNDDGTKDFLNADRFNTPQVAGRYGYGADPQLLANLTQDEILEQLARLGE